MSDFVDILHVVTCIFLDIHWSYEHLLFWAGIIRNSRSANQIVRCFKLKELESYMRYQVDFLLSFKLQKISCCFRLCRKILLANQFAGFFHFWLFWLVNLNTGGPLLHCTCFILFLSMFLPYDLSFSSLFFIKIKNNKKL